MQAQHECEWGRGADAEAARVCGKGGRQQQQPPLLEHQLEKQRKRNEGEKGKSSRRIEGIKREVERRWEERKDPVIISLFPCVSAPVLLVCLRLAGDAAAAAAAAEKANGL